MKGRYKMNYYFLIEDELSFMKILPKWLNYIGFSNTRVVDIEEVTNNCYVLQSGHGVTQLITKVLFETIDTITCTKYHGKIDELVIILDSEQYDTVSRKKEVSKIIDDYLAKKKITPQFSYKIFVCNHCFETWLLGNGNLYPCKEPPQDCDFWSYYINYNIKMNDPEDMRPPHFSKESIGQYHFRYLHELCRYNNIRYSKKKPQKVGEKSYFQAIEKRIHDTHHLNSFREFYTYFRSKAN